MSQLQKIRLSRFKQSQFSRNVIHVFEANLNRPLQGELELLDDSERARAYRFVLEKDRKRFLTSHALTRQVIGTCVDCDPASLKFEAGVNGKPFLVDRSDEFRFNISHSSDRLLIAVAWGQEVGIDVEKHRPLNGLELAQRFFATGEVADLQSILEHEQHAAFFRCWTRKEAFVKAIGKGLSLPLAQFRVSVEDSASEQLLLACEFDPDLLQTVRIVNLPSPVGYSAALAAGVGDWTIARWVIDKSN